MDFSAMTKRILGAFAIVVVAVWAVTVQAQTRLSREQVVTSMQGLDPLARKLDITFLRQRIIDGIRANPGEPALNRPPISAQLAQLAQFVIEIKFNFDSDVIRPESYRTVGVIADALHHPNLLLFRFLIIGHTDAKGDRMYNFELSQRRARSVRNALIGLFRVPPQRLLTLGMGEEQLRDPKKPDSIINRRVQLINIGE
jgi:OOP family OmpA-OmpF porin